MGFETPTVENRGSSYANRIAPVPVVRARQNLPLVRKYETLFAMLDLSHIPEFNYGVGADGASQLSVSIPTDTPQRMFLP
ncbi:MAG: hypothetical protein N3D11_18125, partial [Candidatus Sumerlaeia bacterium]|nr:hypothetical protein [Candidatus Sumerlaeia bacterium]